MDRYANEIVAGLRRFGAGLDVHDVRMEPETCSAPRLVSKAVLYTRRYLVYPYRVSKLSCDVYHITDHAHAHLVRALDATRTIVTCHDLMRIVKPPDSSDRSLVPWISSKAYAYSVAHLKQAARIVADSENTKRDLVAYGGCEPDRIRVVSPGLSAQFQPGTPDAIHATRRRWGLEGKAVLLHVGSQPYKNVVTVVRVLEKLTNRFGLPVSLLKVGADFSEAEAAYIEHHGLSGRIVLLRAPAEEQLVEAYQCADALLFPSTYEGFGWPPLEAMACGVPVVSSNAGSLPEVVGDAAIQCDPHDVDGQARAIASVLTTSALRADLIAKGLERVGAFTWQSAIGQLRDVYAEVAAPS